MSNNKYQPIVKRNEEVCMALRRRMDELHLKLIDLHLDAKQRGVKISYQSLSKYFNRSEENHLPEEHIAWLCARYGIPIELNVGLPDDNIDYTLPAYNEKECLKKLKKMFP